MSRDYLSSYRRDGPVDSSRDKEKDRKILDLEDKVKELEEKVKNQKEKYEKMKLAKDDIEKAIKQEKSEYKLQSDNLQEKVTLLEKQHTETTGELGKVQRSIHKKNTEMEELRILNDEASNNINITKAAIQKSELSLKQNERSMDTVEKTLSKAESSHEKTSQKIIQLEDDLKTTNVSIEETRQELELAHKLFISEVKVLEDEIYEEVSMREMLTKVKSELEDENLTLLTYFTPKAEIEEENRPRLRTYETDFSLKCKEALYNELETLKVVNENKKKHKRDLKELQQSLATHISMMPLELKEDLSFELEDLMKYMTLAGLKTKEKLYIFTTLVEHRCDPGIVRELANVASEMTEENVHFLETPEPIITIALRTAAFNTTDPRAFRNAVLHTLAVLRAKKTKQDVEYSRIVILEGGEYDEEV